MKCKCNNVEIGSYDNQVELFRPPHMPIKAEKHISPIICVDACLKKEILSLWKLGISTTGCCCGHNKTDGYIGVIDADIVKMKELGYKVFPNECRPGDEDSFYPKMEC